MRINYNALAMNATTNFGKINNKVAKSMSRLSSGYKITSPADDAAGLAISKKMSAQIRGLDRAALNSNDGISVIQSAEGGMEEMHSILGRMRELAVQAANDVNDEVDRDAIQEEIDSLAAELTQISDTTAFNGQTLLNGDLTRRSLSSVNGVKATYISSEVSTGVYSINVTADAEQASMTTGFTYSTAVITKEQAGTLKVNGFAIEIEEGMTMEDVYGKIQTSLPRSILMSLRRMTERQRRALTVEHRWCSAQRDMAAVRNQHLCGKSGAGSGVWSDRWHDDAGQGLSGSFEHHRRWIFYDCNFEDKWK